MNPAIARAVNASPLFAGMAIDESSIRIETLRKGRLCDDVRGSCGCIGLILEGTIDVYSVTAGGSEIRLSCLEMGDSFGICNLCSNNALPTVLRCRTACRVMLMPKKRFAAIIEKDPILAMRYARICNEKIAFLIKRIGELARSIRARNSRRTFESTPTKTAWFASTGRATSSRDTWASAVRRFSGR